MPTGGRPRESEAPHPIHTEKTHEFKAPRDSSEIPTHAKPNLETLPHEVALRRLAEDAGERLIEEADILEEAPDTENVQRLQRQLLESFIHLQQKDKEWKDPEEDESDKKKKDKKQEKKAVSGRPLSPKAKRVLKTYLPRLFERVPTPRAGKEEEDAPYKIDRNPTSKANTDGVARLLSVAGFSPETTTLSTLRHDLPQKRAELTAEIERRSALKKGQLEAGIDPLLRQSEALDVLQDVIGIREEQSPREKILTEARNQTAREKEKRDERVKPIIVERIKREIATFTKTFTDRYESSTTKQVIAEQRARPTETALPVIDKPTAFGRLQNKVRSLFTKTIPVRNQLPASARTPEPSLRSVRTPTFSESGFLSSSGIQSALEGNFTSFEELREKVVERIFRNEKRLEERYSAELAEHPVATLDALADVDDHELKQLLGNHEVLERILEIIDNREVFLEGKDLQFDKEKISSQTTELGQLDTKKPGKSDTKATQLLSKTSRKAS